MATLVNVRLGLAHAAIAELYGVDRSTVSGAIREVRPLLAARGFAVPGPPGCGCAHWRTCSRTPTLKASTCASTAPKFRSAARARVAPAAGRSNSGKRKQNTIKTTTFSDAQGRTLFSGADRPGRMHDQTAVRTEGIAEQFRQHSSCIGICGRFARTSASRRRVRRVLVLRPVPDCGTFR
ncbi:transposase family protein [Streptomyces pratensis]|uniref:transposase family protein n=1 Tax=Streptomyces pratensis TaxID=1169025 RepID=UPI003017B8CC